LLTISQLNKIGERLRKNLATEDDLRSLDEFRLLFQPAYDEVFAELSQMGLNPGGRPQKTTLSIIAKLNRERTRLSRMQDIAGCRVVVDSMIDQDRVVDDLKARWQDALVHDRRIKPSHGYRAVHVIVTIKEHPVEIQVRTSLQHSWASATEKLSDVFDPAIKYGGGPLPIQEVLIKASKSCAQFEDIEYKHSQTLQDLGITEAKFEEFLTELRQKGVELPPEMKLIQKHGGIKGSLEHMEREMKLLREEVHTMLKELSEQSTIRARTQ
jgi:putative GTP pyrophosphokinase